MKNLLVTAYLADNAAYIAEGDAAAIERIPDAAWPAILAALDELSGGATEPGIDCSVTTTSETLADFDRSRLTFWSEAGSRSEHEFSGLQAVKYERFQLRRGDPRRDMIVVDIGERRIALR